VYGIISIYIYIYIYCEWTEGLRQRGVAGKSERGVAGAASGAAVVGREARSAAEELLRCLLNPSAAQNIPQDSIARRVLEAASLVLNLIAFYLIVYLNTPGIESDCLPHTHTHTHTHTGIESDCLLPDSVSQ
jgi:hypothetical protein